MWLKKRAREGDKLRKMQKTGLRTEKQSEGQRSVTLVLASLIELAG